MECLDLSLCTILWEDIYARLYNTYKYHLFSLVYVTYYSVLTTRMSPIVLQM